VNPSGFVKLKTLPIFMHSVVLDTVSTPQNKASAG